MHYIIRALKLKFLFESTLGLGLGFESTILWFPALSPGQQRPLCILTFTAAIEIINISFQKLTSTKFSIEQRRCNGWCTRMQKWPFLSITWDMDLPLLKNFGKPDALMTDNLEQLPLVTSPDWKLTGNHSWTD